MLGAQIYTSPLLCRVLSLVSLFVLGQCSLKLCQSKEVLSVSLNYLFPGCLPEVVDASAGSSARQCIAWAMRASGLLVAIVSLSSQLAVLFQASVPVLIFGFRLPMYVKKAEADQGN